MRHQSLQIFKLSFVGTVVAALLVLTALPGRAAAQQNSAPASPASSPTSSAVPQIIQFSGQFSGTQGGSVAPVPAGTVSITFTFYENEQGGTALWSETQNVQVDAQGRYSALLGSTSPEGLPLSLFTTGQAHWLAVQPLLQGFAEQPRVLLVSAPYALKAGDAETIGGLPPSAFVRTDASSGTSGTTAVSTTASTGTTVVTTTASKGLAPANTVPLVAFYNPTTGYKIAGKIVLVEPGTYSSGNIALGYKALLNNTTGTGNTASGINALNHNTTGSDNTASGDAALLNNTTGGGNTATGIDALYSNTTANYNTASGNAALFSNTTGGGNTASGNAALYFNTTGADNTASGNAALSFNTTGADNTASGYQALDFNTTGAANTASGYQALYSNTTGSSNTASGDDALLSNTTGSNNTASGAGALYNNTTASYNTASGVGALQDNTTGNNNIAVGYAAATNVSGGNGNNIHIGSQGSSGDSGAIRIGTSGTQTSFFVAGVSGVITGQNNAVAVMIDSNGQLGTVSSSRRFKEDIQDMGNSSSGLMRLRPVTFRYKKPFDDGTKPVQYGLIAEEVAEVYPDLVARSADGQIETVKYQLLDPMLLNEVQRQQKEMVRRQSEAQLQQAKIRDLEGLVKTQQAQIAELVSNVKTIQASLRTRRGSSHARLASAKGTPAPATNDASLPLASSARGGN
jgi:hypothetical protein